MLTSMEDFKCFLGGFENMVPEPMKSWKRSQTFFLKSDEYCNRWANIYFKIDYDFMEMSDKFV
jgi:hypothetical protein